MLRELKLFLKSNPGSSLSAIAKSLGQPESLVELALTQLKTRNLVELKLSSSESCGSNCGCSKPKDDFGHDNAKGYFLIR